MTSPRKSNSLNRNEVSFTIKSNNTYKKKYAIENNSNLN